MQAVTKMADLTKFRQTDVGQSDDFYANYIMSYLSGADDLYRQIRQLFRGPSSRVNKFNFVKFVNEISPNLPFLSLPSFLDNPYLMQVLES